MHVKIKAKSKIIYSLIHFNEFDQFCVVDFESFILGSMNMFLSSKKLFLEPSLVTWQKKQMAPALSGIKASRGLWSTIGLPAQVNILRSHLQNQSLISEKKCHEGDLLCNANK